ncbi:hypothetical protein H5410_050780 [Solanum commersonii]|uniref:Uncharacterized protein n=1 Tax=Solanum commersonii TaxID=4109 RepID=A0A9J5WWE9_SOLCO|nr:hypothetical protein H5410_050780 [Solanum commersonii]
MTRFHQSTFISSKTQEAIDTLISGLQTTLIVQPLSVVKSNPSNETHQLLPDSNLPMEISGNEIVLYEQSETLAQRNMMPSKILKSPYLTEFGSSDKGKQKFDLVVRRMWKSKDEKYRVKSSSVGLNT